jgi:hypothetical protein
MRNILRVLLILAIPVSVLGWGGSMLVVGGGPPAAGGGDFTTETFANLTNWTEIGGNWGTIFSIVSNQLRGDTPSGGAFGATIYNTQSSSLTQHAKMQWVDGYAASEPYVYLLFRRTGTANDKLYAVYWFATTNNVGWGYWTDDSDLQPASDITSGTIGSVLADGEWIGAEVEGTGADTVVRVWKWVSDPGERSSWGAASTTFTTDPGANACDTGLYTGIGIWRGGTSQMTADNWTGGPS